ncbi:MAG: hypothetical protein KGL39_04820 [Patescibacteria group bacterium]|nr:hypothetical protein [Patescibacteria group bacterium]
MTYLLTSCWNGQMHVCKTESDSSETLSPALATETERYRLTSLESRLSLKSLESMQHSGVLAAQMAVS